MPLVLAVVDGESANSTQLGLAGGGCGAPVFKKERAKDEFYLIKLH